MKKENVIVKKNAAEHLAPGGRGWHEVPGEGVYNKANFMGTPSSPLRGTSPARGEVNGGFTLIELLVVVLIIGILTAVALPQYKLAVTKSRVSTYLPIVKSIATANENYYLANGIYVTNATKLDIDLPKSCKTTDSGNIFQCGNDFLFDFSGQDAINLYYCPGTNTSFSHCYAVSDFRMRYDYLHTQDTNSAITAGKLRCLVEHNSNLGKQICKTMTF